MYKINAELSTLLGKLGSEKNLSFSMTEIMKNAAIGLDEEKRTLLIIQRGPQNKYDCHAIHLNNVHTCFVKKTYKNISANDLRRGILEEYLEKITLRLELSKGKQPVEIVFYDHFDNNVFEMPELEQLAKDWEINISRILLKQLRYTSSFFSHQSQYWQGMQ